MDNRDYYALLGVRPSATAADIEAHYLALGDFLASKSVPPHLREWAERQLALADEAYAALSEVGDEEEPTAAKASARREAPTRGQIKPTSPAKATMVRRRPVEDEDEIDPVDLDSDDDDYEDEDDIEDRYEEPRHPQPARRAPIAKGPAVGKGNPNRAEQPRWQQSGRRRGAGYPPERRESPRYAPRSGDGQAKKMLIGFAGGLAVVVIAFLAMFQLQVGPFRGAASVQGGQGQPVAIDQARYNQLQTILRGDPANFPALFELGQMTFEAARYEESISWLEKALVVNPKDVPSLQDVGTANFNLGNLAQAKEMWEKALAVDPNNAQTHWNLGQYYVNLQPQDLDSAVKEWQQVLQFSKPTERLYQLAQIHLQQYAPGLTAATPTPAAR